MKVRLLLDYKDKDTRTIHVNDDFEESRNLVMFGVHKLVTFGVQTNTS